MHNVEPTVLGSISLYHWQNLDTSCNIHKRKLLNSSNAVCSICQETMIVLKEYKSRDIFSTKDANYAANLSS